MVAEYTSCMNPFSFHTDKEILLSLSIEFPIGCIRYSWVESHAHALRRFQQTWHWFELDSQPAPRGFELTDVEFEPGLWRKIGNRMKNWEVSQPWPLSNAGSWSSQLQKPSQAGILLSTKLHWVIRTVYQANVQYSPRLLPCRSHRHIWHSCRKG